MREINRWRRSAAVITVLALALAACGEDGDDDGAAEVGDQADAVEEAVEEADDDADAEADAEADDEADDGDVAAGEIATDLGVTDEPCPEPTNDGNGCIYLGVLSDLTSGPFAPFGTEIVEGQRAFWQRVNEQGGVAGYDVDIDTYTRDNLYDTQEHSTQYRQIEPNILALALTLGTPTTEAILPDMDADDVVGVPASWWSGWHFPDTDKGLILETGYSYCIESQIGLDWIDAERGEITSVQVVAYPGDYGGDYAAGVEAWTDATGVEFLGFVETAPNAVVGTQDAAVGQVLSANADVVMVATGPGEVAEIVGGAAAQGFTGQFMGSAPTWNPALLDSPAGPALEAQFLHIGPHELFDGESEAHQAMRDAVGDGDLPTNDGYTYGWVWSYPLLAALEAAADNGDLTRAGLRAVTDGLVVEYEGALPDTTLSDNPNETANRTAAISEPDADAPLGISSIATNVTGPTADAFEYVERCSG